MSTEPTKQIDDGGPAFPNTARPMAGETTEWGMSLRDWMAGQALAGILAHPKCGAVGPGKERTTQFAALESYAVADAMLAARKGGTK